MWKRSVYGPREGERVFCPLREDPIQHLQTSFESIAGQANALKTVRAALVKNVRLEKGPLVLHIAGPSGVGKSLTARSVARAVMEDTASESGADWCGVSVINGHHFSSRDMQRIRSDSRAIMEQIGSQLKVCPRSVIIMEDIQHMHEVLLQSLATAFDDAFPHVRISASSGSKQEQVGEGQEASPGLAAAEGAYEVSTAAAIFVLVSDLGEESLDPSMGREQAKMAVRNATRKHWPSAKLPKFVHDVVAFLPLNEEEMALVAELELRKYPLRVVMITIRALDWLRLPTFCDADADTDDAEQVPRRAAARKHFHDRGRRGVGRRADVDARGPDIHLAAGSIP
jgi:DNA polymerase III delta prime subunit